MPSDGTSPGYVAGIDGLRAIAVLTVMLYHVRPSWMPGGFAGVDVFFAISGYVVTASLYRHERARWAEFLLGFYGRRLRRIYPALFVCLCASILGVVLFIPMSWLSDAVRTTSLMAFYGFSNVALLSTSDGYFAPRTEFNPFTHTWSLAVEEQFYLLFPLVLWASWQTRASVRTQSLRTRSLWILGAGLTASLAWCALLSATSADRAYYTLLSRFWELAAGAMLFVLLRSDSMNARIERHARTLAWIGLALVAATAISADASRFPFPWALPAVFGTLTLIASLQSAPDSVVAKVLSNRAMVTIGRWSYSLYLWHWPVLVAFRWTIGLSRASDACLALLLTFALSALSYAAIERPVLQSAALQRRSPAFLVAAGTLLIIGAVQAATRVYWRQVAWSRSVVMQRAAEWYPDADQRMATTMASPCDVQVDDRIVDGALIETFTPVRCRDVRPADRRVFVLGDSHAGAYARLLHMLAERDGITVTSWRRGDCGIANLQTPLRAKSASCQSFASSALAAITRQARPNDVIFLASLRSVRLGDQWATYSPSSVDSAVSGAAAIAARVEALADADRIVRLLSRTGATVVIDGPKPVFPSPAFRCADPYTQHNPICEAGSHVSRAALERLWGPVRTSLATLHASNPEMVVWDPMPTLCPADPCRAVVNGHPMFFDGDHVSGYANEVLHPVFRAMLHGLAVSAPATRAD